MLYNYVYSEKDYFQVFNETGLVSTCCSLNYHGDATCERHCLYLNF